MKRMNIKNRNFPVRIAFISFNFVNKSSLILLTLTIFASQLWSQKTLTPSITLQMPEGGGANAAAIVWHPIIKKYYAPIVGNADFAMAIFDAKGKVITDTLTCGYDFRGMWYNPISKRIEFNCYSDFGWGHLILDVQGNIKDRVIDFYGMNQPNEQSVGVYYTPGSMVIFLNPQTLDIEKYNTKTAIADSVLLKIYVGCKTQDEVNNMLYEEDDEVDRWLERNIVVQYTGKPNQEFAVVNTTNRTIELYSQKTGLITDTYSIPEGVTLEKNFNFTYCNNIWWFYSKAERKWYGYKYLTPAVKAKK